MYGISLNSDLNSFKKLTKLNIINMFIQNWSAEINNLEQNPITSTYSVYKQEFGTEPYLNKVLNFKYIGKLLRNFEPAPTT